MKLAELFIQLIGGTLTLIVGAFTSVFYLIAVVIITMPLWGIAGLLLLALLAV